MGRDRKNTNISLAAFYTRGESGRWAGLFNTKGPFPRGGESLSKVQHLKEKGEALVKQNKTVEKRNEPTRTVVGHLFSVKGQERQPER